MQGKRNKRCILSFFGALSTLFAQGFQFVDCIIFPTQQSTPPDALFVYHFSIFAIWISLNVVMIDIIPLHQSDLALCSLGLWLLSKILQLSSGYTKAIDRSDWPVFLF